MTQFKKLAYFAAPSLVVALAAFSAAGCDPNASSSLKESHQPYTQFCDDCGSLSDGDLGISGNVKIDGLFAAVSQLHKATLSATGDFELGLANLEVAWGIKAKGDLKSRVDTLLTAIKTDFGADTEASLRAEVAQAHCSANLRVAVEAQAVCEAKAGCTADVAPGSVAVKCDGSCTGSCEGSCAAEANGLCEVHAGGVACNGICEGICELDASLECLGTCKGSCIGECSVRNGDGSCNGECAGKCEGSCDIFEGAECKGSCHGSCTAEAPEGGCDAQATLKCEGSCDGTCSGSCEGSATPISASVDCPSSADCNLQASAQGSASLECTPPSIEWSLDPGPSADASLRAELGAKLVALRANAGVMVGSFTKLEALITGKVNGEETFEPPPILAVTGALEGVVQAGVQGELFIDIPPGNIVCVIPAMGDAVGLLVQIGGEAPSTIGAQAKFVTSLSTDFND